MSRPLAIREGPFGRIVVLDATTPLAPHAHPEHLMLFKYDGADACYRIAGRHHAFNREVAVFVNALEIHDNGRACEGDATRLLAAYLSPDWLAAVLPGLTVRRAERPFPRPSERITAPIRQLADALVVDTLSGAPDDDARLGFLVQELVLAVVGAYVAPRARDAWDGSRFADHRVRRALALMRARVAGNLELEAIAAEVGLSRSRFYELFQLCTGISPRAYVDMLRLEVAISRLSGGAQPIGDIAADLGFSAHGNFTRFFVSHIGMPPSGYRGAARRSATLRRSAARG